VIDLEAFAQFVSTTIPVNPLYRNEDVHPHVANDQCILQEIACGVDIWDREDLSTAPFRLKVFRKYANIFTNNQGAERGNKDQNEAASYGREELRTSLVMAGQSFLKEQCKTTVLGQKRESFQGKKKIHEMLSRIQFVHQKMQDLRQKLGSELFDKRLNEIKEKVYVTFTSVRKGVAEESFKAIINQPHVPSAKERVSGIHYSPMVEGFLQFGKLPEKGTNNLILFKHELRGRQMKSLNRELTRDEERAINVGINRLKAAVRADEKSHYASEYQNGYDDKFFKPRHTAYNTWTWSKV
jgi:hypothetical protein